MNKFIKYIARIFIYFTFIKIVRIFYDSDVQKYNKDFFIICCFAVLGLFTGLIVVVALAARRGRAAAQKWPVVVKHRGEEWAAAKSRLTCELIACIGILSSLPSAYASGTFLGEHFMIPFLQAVVSYLAFFAAASVSYSRAMHSALQ